ncbi:MAG: hypothetical protein OK422_06630 [Thaumarchaeota archaeon]|nr:hypothetical protein [Nitrososphaerota archaeon]
MKSVVGRKKFELYKTLYAHRDDIVHDAKKFGRSLDFLPKDRGKFGLTGAHSSYPGPIGFDVLKEITRAQKQMRPLPDLVDELRSAVKDYYGDEFDAAPIGSGEAALWVAFDVLATPPLLGHGSPYRTRYVAPLERHVTHQSGFGRPFPARYKYVGAERYATAGELGVEGKRLNNLDVVLVPLDGARYDSHGIKYYPVPLLSRVDAKKSGETLAEVAERHAAYLSAFASLGYDVPGYGYSDKTPDDVPELQFLIGKLASKYDVPYITDNAWGAPILGTDIRKTGASLMFYSIDKVLHGPLSALIIGKEDVMVAVRRALGTHSTRSGNPSGYSKAMYSAFDPGREAIVAQNYIVRKLVEEPKLFTKPVDETYKIVREEFAGVRPGKFKKDLLITKTYNNLSVEVNYDRTWKNDDFGIPIFSEEDSFAGLALIETAVAAMGVLPTITYDGNILIAPGHGTIDDEGSLIGERMRAGVRALVGAIEIVCRRAGLQ